jgi:hypothetical protein
MKKTLLFLFLFLSVSIAFSQFKVYHHFPDSNAAWRETYYDGSSGTGCFADSGYAYTLQGDTLVSGKIYHKVYEEGGYVTFCPAGRADYYHKYFAAAIREDTMKHVFLCCTKSLGTKDTLLYDFNMKVGDTLHQYNAGNCPYCNPPYYVTSIDSIQLKDSSYRKRFMLNSSYSAIIEGIGSSNGLLEPINVPFEVFSTLDCFKQNSKFLYSSYIADSCPMFYVTDDIPVLSQEYKVNLYPNPAGDNINVDIKGIEGKITCTLYDVIGQQIWSDEVNSVSSSIVQTISVAGFNTGIYILKLKTEVGETIVKKVEVTR